MRLALTRKSKFHAFAAFAAFATGCVAVDEDSTDAEASAVKASLPETNLRDYPKRAARVAEADPAQRGAPATDVLSFSTEGDVTTFETFDPAPGVSPEALAAWLRSEGRQDVQLVRHDDSARNLGPYDCSYGQAHTANCPVRYWLNNGESNPIVLFNDHSGVTWPVSNAVYKWNQVLGIDSVYRYNTCSGSFPGAHCVNVYSANYGNQPWIGHTLTRTSGQVTISSYVELNDYFDPIAYNFTRNHLATHELGHVLGLGHNDWSGDLMYEFANKREDLGGENQALLQALYSVDR